MDNNKSGITFNPWEPSETSKILNIENYSDKRKALQRREGLEENRRKVPGKVMYLDEDRQKTLDLFARVLHTMKKESYQ